MLEHEINITIKKKYGKNGLLFLIRNIILSKKNMESQVEK